MYLFRVDDEEHKYEARVYEVKKNWEIEIVVDEEDSGGTKMFCVRSGERVELEHFTLKTYRTRPNPSEPTTTGVKEMLETVNTTINTIAGAAEAVSTIADLFSVCNLL